MGRRYPIEARDTGGYGCSLCQLLVDLRLCTTYSDANSIIRTGLVEIGGEKIRDVLHHVKPGSYLVKIRGEPQAEVTLL